MIKKVLHITDTVPEDLDDNDDDDSTILEHCNNCFYTNEKSWYDSGSPVAKKFKQTLLANIWPGCLGTFDEL